MVMKAQQEGVAASVDMYEGDPQALQHLPSTSLALC